MAADLPDDIDELKRRVLLAEAVIVVKTPGAEKLKLELARLKRMQFGQSSERIEREKLKDIAQSLDTQLARIPGKSDLAKAIRYARSRWLALNAYVNDGRLEMSSNAAEYAIRTVTLGGKNWLFVGSGGERAAIRFTLLRITKLNGVEPEA